MSVLRVKDPTTGDWLEIQTIKGDRGPQGPKGDKGDPGQNGTATDAQVAAWLDEHPEATTTVQDGSITKAKLHSDLVEEMLTKNELVYVTPEMFEAYRTSENDDYAVITACLSYAISNNVPVRGFGRYTISRGIELECDDMDIFINILTIASASTDAVVKLTGYRNKIRINRINAYNIRVIGFWLYGKNSHWSEFNTIHLPCIYAGNDAVFVSAESNSAYACENIFHVQSINSGYENCIHIVSGYGENAFYGGGGHVSCPSGWAIKLTSSGGNKFYDFALEGHVRSGIYLDNSSANFISGFRIAELRNQKTPTSGDVGTVAKFIGCSNSNRFECAEGMNMVDIDVTEAKSNDELTVEEIETAYSINVFNVNGVRGCGYNWSDGIGYYALYGKELIVLRNKKIAVPVGIMQTDVDGNIAYGVDEGRDILFNWFTMKTDATITLCDSYCPIGFNEIYIDQTDGKATVYKNGSVIFNGANFGNGIYKLICFCDTKNNVYNSIGIHSDHGAAFYDGENEVWKVISE